MIGRKHAEEHENHERWLVSYADFITLLFAFFVVLYSVSKVDNKKLVETAHAIKWAMHFAGTGGVGEMPIFDTAVADGACPANIKVTYRNYGHFGCIAFKQCCIITPVTDNNHQAIQQRKRK